MHGGSVTEKAKPLRSGIHPARILSGTPWQRWQDSVGKALETMKPRP